MNIQNPVFVIPVCISSATSCLHVPFSLSSLLNSMTKIVSLSCLFVCLSLSSSRAFVEVSLCFCRSVCLCLSQGYLLKSVTKIVSLCFACLSVSLCLSREPHQKGQGDIVPLQNDLTAPLPQKCLFV